MRLWSPHYTSQCSHRPARGGRAHCWYLWRREAVSFGGRTVSEASYFTKAAQIFSGCSLSQLLTYSTSITLLRGIMHKHERSVSSDPELAAASRLDTPSADVYELMNQFVCDRMIKNHVRERDRKNRYSARFCQSVVLERIWGGIKKSRDTSTWFVIRCGHKNLMSSSQTSSRV